MTQNVKLNNPLMGTETTVHPSIAHLFKVFEVKLNNPLMGTETICRFKHDSS